jgi:hypothetical protein
MTQRRVIAQAAADALAPRIQFTRKRPAPPALSAEGCWTAGRLSNAPVMIATMLDACNDATILSQIYEVVDSDRRRRAAASAA